MTLDYLIAAAALAADGGYTLSMEDTARVHRVLVALKEDITKVDSSGNLEGPEPFRTIRAVLEQLS